MISGPPSFRPGTVLATSFTGTLTERHGSPVERIPTTERLCEWFAQRDLAVTQCAASELQDAWTLREAIHAAATAAATGAALPEQDVRRINGFSLRGSVAPVLMPDGSLHWNLGHPASIDAALSVIAADAVGLLSGARPGTFALCASPTCRAAFFDTSRSGTRRWCDMNTCGNREKKARLRERSAPAGRSTARSGSMTPGVGGSS
ncbi:CGNR zinc finger domain-containing protein [Microbacterium sp. P06]|uniref:CGNR zinc finger domain-containing protein n=1 Tax=unclassified Microbacterium TaxID=2609290 RepID=UPI003744D8D7